MNELPSILRIKTPEGDTLRISPESTDISTTSFYKSSIIEKVHNRFAFGTWSFDPEGLDVVPQSYTLCQFKNGDILYFKPSLPSSFDNEQRTSISLVDRFLSTQDGKILRKRDPLLCSHPQNGMCGYCSSLDPFDSDYHSEKGIKHLSYWAYVKSFQKNSNSEYLSYLPPPPEPDIQTGTCLTGRHLPYPEGMCSACQPSPITLQQQKFRMVDHVEFLDSDCVDRFISNWRKTSHQIFAWLIGKYDRYSGVPLGIKGVVHDLWIPLQESAPDGVELLMTDSPWYKLLELLLERALVWLELEKIGAIWTDLILSSNDQTDGTVAKLRGPDTFFVSGWETILMARLQLQYPVSGMLNSTASRWISVVVSGDENERISLHSYQLSLQATAMAKANILYATSQAPYCAIWSASNKRPLPDLFYRKNLDDSNSSEQCKAAPEFPTEYLLVSLTHGFLDTGVSSHDKPSQKFDISSAFVRANGDVTCELFLKSLFPWFKEDKSPIDLMETIHSDLGILVSLYGMNIFSKDELQLLKVKSTDFFNSSGWNEFYSKMTSINMAHHQFIDNELDASWSCNYCTLINTGDAVDCEACGLPRS